MPNDNVHEYNIVIITLSKKQIKEIILMNEKNEKLTPEQMAAIETAKRQGKISEKEMSELVKSTLEQFLLGEFEFEDGGDVFIIYFPIWQEPDAG